MKAHPQAPISNPDVTQPFHTYPGGKAAVGVLQYIINRIPRHNFYMEPFLGGGAIYLNLRRASRAFLNDISPSVYEAWKDVGGISTIERPEVALMQRLDFFEWWRLRLDLPYAAQQYMHRGTFIFLDPPYLLKTRSAQRKLYDYEFETEEQHARLLDLLVKRAPYSDSTRVKSPNVMICGYPSETYTQRLEEEAGWLRHDFRGHSRQGRRDECLWTNYDPAQHLLHDYTYIGKDFRARETFRKRKARWLAGLGRMKPREAQALVLAIKEEFLDQNFQKQDAR